MTFIEKLRSALNGNLSSLKNLKTGIICTYDSENHVSTIKSAKLSNKSHSHVIISQDAYIINGHYYEKKLLIYDND